MTPDDLAAIRADLNVFGECSVKRARALCDALEAEIAKRQRAFAEMLEERERAERAEAELSSRRPYRARALAAEAELVDLQAWADHESDRADRAEETSANERQKVVNLTGELAVVNDHLADVIELIAEANRANDYATRMAQVAADNEQAALAAMARVRDLCDREEAHLRGENADALVSTEQVRAAVEGDTQ